MFAILFIFKIILQINAMISKVIVAYASFLLPRREEEIFLLSANILFHTLYFIINEVILCHMEQTVYLNVLLGFDILFR